MIVPLHGLVGALVLASLTSAATTDIDRQAAGAEAITRSASEITNSEWRQAFDRRQLTYREPRLVFLRRPPGHPGRGTRYASGIIVVDLDDVQRLSNEYGERSSALIEVLVAHEIAHHVQTLLASSPFLQRVADAGAKRELQADCLAGWSIGRANSRQRPVVGGPIYVLTDAELTGIFASDLPSPADDGEGEWARSHGTTIERIAAVREGMASDALETCLPLI